MYRDQKSKRLLAIASWNAEMNALVPISSGAALSAALAPELTRAAELAEAEKAEATRRAYRSDFRIFQAWCQDRGVSSLPAAAETVADVLRSRQLPVVQG